MIIWNFKNNFSEIWNWQFFTFPIPASVLFRFFIIFLLFNEIVFDRIFKLILKPNSILQNKNLNADSDDADDEHQHPGCCHTLSISTLHHYISYSWIQYHWNTSLKKNWIKKYLKKTTSHKKARKKDTAALLWLVLQQQQLMEFISVRHYPCFVNCYSCCFL